MYKRIAGFLIFNIVWIVITILMFAMKIPEILQGIVGLNIWIFQVQVIIMGAIFSAIITYGCEED